MKSSTSSHRLIGIYKTDQLGLCKTFALSYEWIFLYCLLGCSLLFIECTYKVLASCANIRGSALVEISHHFILKNSKKAFLLISIIYSAYWTIRKQVNIFKNIKKFLSIFCSGIFGKRYVKILRIYHINKIGMKLIINSQQTDCLY